MKRITVLILVLLFNFTECFSSTLYYEIGSEICLNFTNITQNLGFRIKRNNDSICFAPDASTMYLFPQNWNNKTFNCTFSGKGLFVCFDFQLEDIGLFSLHKSVGTEYLQIINLERAVSVASVDLTPASISMIAGQTMNLTCRTSHCNPPANITWYLSLTDITSYSSYEWNKVDGLFSTTSLLLMRVDKFHTRKHIYCTARNIPGRTVNSTFPIVNVLYVPEVILKTQNPHSVVEGGTAVLKCEVIDANPDINITWRWFKSSNNASVYHGGPTYTISNIKRNKTGFYNCIAINSAGTSVPVSTYVNVQYKPEISAKTKSPYRVIEGQVAALECELMDANPNASITWKWSKLSSTTIVLNNGPIYEISNVMRNSSGSYICSAINSIGPSKEVTIIIDVQYKPEVISITPSPLKVIEGFNATMECKVNDSNPSTGITWGWFKTGTPTYAFYDGPTYIIPKIQRNRTGSYSCRANNSVGTSVAVTIDVDVQYKPTIIEQSSTTTNEGERVVLSRLIDSNPLSNVSWYKGSEYLITDFLVNKAILIIDKASCTDTNNFTLVASNTVEQNVTALVELIVNCKPQIYDKNITLGVTDTTGIEFSITVIAYPEPHYEVRYENGSNNDKMMTSITRNAVNNFTIRVNQTDVKNSDYGVYLLVLRNSYGNATAYVNVIPQRKPDMPIITDYVCEVKTARVQWESSFNGGDPQSFTVVALHGNRIENKTDTISDQGINEIHSTFVQNLQSSTTYVFSVAAHNKHGFSLSKNVSCTTMEEDGVNLPLIAGGAVAGGVTLAIVAIVIVLMFRRYTKNEERTGKPQRLEDELAENRVTDDDGLKENILYVSADTRDIDKPESAVYAAVNKKSQESNNNASVYAEVNKSEPKFGKGAVYSDVKPKKGFFKKSGQDKTGGKATKSKGKKQKNKQEDADVYENSEGIAMTANVDNVYSNSEHKNQSETEQRGYKNKDGLLYVEVSFGGKQGQDNPVIHGEDEKTDYATVEFPMPSALHKASGSEEL